MYVLLLANRVGKLVRNFYAWQESAYESSTLPVKHSLANNLINRICEEVHRWG